MKRSLKVIKRAFDVLVGVGIGRLAVVAEIAAISAAACFHVTPGEAPEHADVPGCAGDARRGQERPPQIRVGREPHALGHDADDRVGDLVDLQRAADHGGIAAVAVLPELIADDDDGAAPAASSPGAEVAAEKRLLAQQAEGVGVTTRR